VAIIRMARMSLSPADLDGPSGLITVKISNSGTGDKDKPGEMMKMR
jgi:hypothetical protein